ncbi:hypothetical protein D3C78_984400 [compost metagenome]
MPPAAVGARHAAAGRTDQPPGRRLGGLAGALPPRLPRHRGGDHPRPLLPRQRRRLDSRTRPRPGHPLRGQLLAVAGIQGRPSGPGVQAGSLPRQGHEGRAGVGAPGRQGPPGQVQGAPAALRGNAVAGIPEAQRDQRDLHPGRSAPGRQGHRVQRRVQGLRRPPADRRPELQPAQGRHRRRDRRQRRGQVDPVPHDPRPRAAGLRDHRHRRERADRQRRPEPRKPRRQQDRVGAGFRRLRHDQGRQLRGAVARLRRPLQLQGRRPAEVRQGPLRR